MSDFEDRSGVVACNTSWGRWYQGLEDVTLEINLVQGTKGREVKVDISSRRLQCQIRGHVVIKGRLFDCVIEDESTWTIEDQNLLRILLVKSRKGSQWPSLLEDGQYQPDPDTLLQMRHKVDLERLQLENPGLDFSQAKLDKQYTDLLDPHTSNNLSGGVSGGGLTVSLGENKTDDEKLLEAASLQQLEASNVDSLQAVGATNHFPSRTAADDGHLLVNGASLHVGNGGGGFPGLAPLNPVSVGDDSLTTLTDDSLADRLAATTVFTEPASRNGGEFPDRRLAVTDDTLAATAAPVTDDSRRLVAAVTDDSLAAAASSLTDDDSLASRLAAVETDDMKRGNGHDQSSADSGVGSAASSSSPADGAVVMLDSSRETDDMKTEPETAAEPVVTDDMKTEENESLETDEQKSGN